MRVLGISAFYHDSAAALIEDGQILSAVQEERFTRRKHDARFPRLAIEFCLGQTGVSLSEVDYIAFYDKPFLKFERLLETYLAFAPRGFKSFRTAMPIWLREKLFQKSVLRRALSELNGGLDPGDRLLFAEHHQSHAASAFFASPFKNAVVLTSRRSGRMGNYFSGLGVRQPARNDERDTLSAFDRAALFRVHTLHRFQGQFGRIQVDGSGALRLAALSRFDPRQSYRFES